MKKTSRIALAALAVTTLLGLTGCSEVAVSAAVVDNENAVFAIEQRLSPEALDELIEVPRSDLSPAASSALVPASQGAFDLNGLWTQSNGDTQEGYTQELEVTDSEVKVYSISGDQRTLRWSGSFTQPPRVTRAYEWTSNNTSNDAELGELPTLDFSLSEERIFYVDTNPDGTPRGVFFTREEPITVVETAGSGNLGESFASNEELCEYLEALSESVLPPIEGAERVTSCDENGFRTVATYIVTYGYTGITSVGGVEITPAQARELPFSFGVDVVYNDVLFEHRILGLNDPDLIPTVAEWKNYVSDYSVTVSFPGDVTGFSGDGEETSAQSVTWNFETISNLVSNGERSVSAAGRADYKVDPLPIIMTIFGILFLLLLVVYFMWKRFSPRVIVIVSYCLAIFGPFGLALALVAKRKSRNNADGASRAVAAIWITSAIFAFELIVIALLLILTPQFVTEILAELGLATSEA